MADKPNGSGSARPYRIWDPQTESYRRYRYFASPLRAHIGAFVEAKWDLKVGQSIEVVNHDTGRRLGTYTRRIKNVTWD